MEDISRTVFELTEALEAERRRWAEAQPHVKRGRFFDAIFRDMLDGVAIINPEGVLMDANPAFCSMTGFEREDVVGTVPPYPHWPREEREVNHDIFRQAMRGDLSSSVVTLRRKDGSRFRALLTPSLVRRDDGSVIAVFATVKDLTEHELDQEALRESEALYRSVVETAREAIYVQNSTGRLIAWNAACARIFALGEIAVISPEHGFDLVPGWRNVREDGTPLSREEMPSYLAFRTGQVQRDVVVGAARGDEHHWIECTATPLFNAGEARPYAVVSICSDITERRRAEDESRAGEEMRDATELLTGSGSLTLNVGTRQATWSRGMRRLFDLDDTPTDALEFGQRAELIVSRIHPDDRDTAWSALRGYLAGDPAPVDFRVTHRDGDVLALHAEPVAGDRDPESGITVHLQDVTARRKAEAEIQSLRHMRDTAEQASRTGSIRYEFATRRALCSSGLFALFDVDPEEFDGDIEPFIASRIHPDQRKAFRERIAAAAETGESASHDYRIVWRDGSTHLLHGVGVVEKDENDKPVALIGSLHDVTERRRQEDEIEALIRMRDTAEQAGNFGSVRLDFRAGRASWTAGMAALLDLDPGELEGDLEELVDARVHPEDRAALREALSAAAARGESPPLEFRVTGRDGSVRLLHGEGVVETDEDGRSVAVTGSYHDITRLHEATAALRESEELFRHVFEGNAVGGILTDLDGTVLYVNDATCRIFGCAAGDLLGRDFREFGAEDGNLEARRLAEALLDGTRASLRLRQRLYPADGSVRWADVSATLQRDTDGRPLHFIASLVDVTEQVAAEEEIRRLNTELTGRVISTTEQRDALNRELEAYAYSIAHDVRAPLRSIDGFSAVVLEADGERLSEEGSAALHRVRLAAQRLARLLDDLMGLSHVSQRDLLRRAVNVSALAAEVGEELAVDNASRCVRLVVQPGMGAKADKALVRLALRELLGNAWKFTRPHAEATIEVGSLDVDGEQVFFVRDDGVGFDMRFADHLFGAFQRMHASDQFPGDGIGLATVQRLVLRHGGRIWAEAAVEHGATFFFTLEARGAGAAAAGEPAPGH
jgi:PAS domain S-box-containing protein